MGIFIWYSLGGVRFKSITVIVSFSFNHRPPSETSPFNRSSPLLIAFFTPFLLGISSINSSQKVLNLYGVDNNGTVCDDLIIMMIYFTF